MKLILIIIFFTNWAQLNSQSCDGFNKNTFQNTVSIWDWRNTNSTNWEAKIDYGNGAPTIRSLNSPFEPDNTGQMIGLYSLLLTY